MNDIIGGILIAQHSHGEGIAVIEDRLDQQPEVLGAFALGGNSKAVASGHFIDGSIFFRPKDLKVRHIFLDPGDGARQSEEPGATASARLGTR